MQLFIGFKNKLPKTTFSQFKNNILSIMTNHFVNLVSWKYFIKKPSDKRNIFIDSLSLYFCCRLFGFSTKKISGVYYFHNNIDIENSLFLLSEDNNLFKNNIVLPFWNYIDEISLDNLLIQKIDEYESIVIGISSPKQDCLADLINDLYPEKKIFCLGAAVYTSSNSLISDKFRLNWLTMMLNDFSRFKEKIKITIKEILSIIFISKSREKFREFLKNNNKT